MISISEVIETNEMIDKENLDVRTITLGISLLDCISSDIGELNENIRNKILKVAKNLKAAKSLKAAKVKETIQNIFSYFPEQHG